MMNPLLIRTLRQEVRNRAFLGIYLALLAAGALTSAVVAASNDGERPGQILFVILSLASTGALWFYQPLTAYRAMAREREDDTWDLMELTGMSPGRIARGIVATSLVQGLFILAALAPFLAVAYLLRGVDVVTLVIFLAGALAGALSLGALATLLGCLGKTKATRTGLVSLLTIALLLLWLISWPIWIEVTRRSGIAGAIASNPLGGWLVAGTTLWHILLAGGLCLILAMTLMTHRAGDRSRLPRIAVLVVAVDDRDIAIKIVRHARHQRPDLHIVARARDRPHVYELFQAGANDIVRETFDSSVRAGRYVLENMGFTQYEAAQLSQTYFHMDRAAMRDLAALWVPGQPIHLNQAYIDRAKQLDRDLETALIQALDETPATAAE